MEPEVVFVFMKPYYRIQQWDIWIQFTLSNPNYFRLILIVSLFLRLRLLPLGSHFKLRMQLHLLCECYMSNGSHPSWTDHLNDTSKSFANLEVLVSVNVSVYAYLSFAVNLSFLRHIFRYTRLISSNSVSKFGSSVVPSNCPWNTADTCLSATHTA